MMRRVLSIVLFGCFGFSVSTASGHVLSTKLAFDASRAEVPESITIDHDGNLFFSLGSTIQRVGPRGTRSIWATLPISAIALGVKVGPDGCVYAVSTSLSSTPGAFVWRSCSQGSITPFAELDQRGGPNDLAFDQYGNLYVTDPFLGRVWRVTAEGTVSIWLEDPLLEGDSVAPVLGFHACGVDGLAFDWAHRHLYLGNLDFGLILKVEIRREGRPGAVNVFSSDANLVGVDGIAFNSVGELYATINSQNAIAVINRRGESRWLLHGDALDSPSSIVFGNALWSRHTAYLLSSSFSRAYGYVDGTPRPQLQELWGVLPGLRLP
jgi:sugar lactone lactonase YvrE